MSSDESLVTRMSAILRLRFSRVEWETENLDGRTYKNETVSLGHVAISLDTLQVQLNFFGGGVFLGSQNSKCQVLSNFSFPLGDGDNGGWKGEFLE